MPLAALLLLPLCQLAMAVALRWRLGGWGWLALLLIAVDVWFIGAALPILSRWELPLPVSRLLLGGLVGIVALAWSGPRRRSAAAPARA